MMSLHPFQKLCYVKASPDLPEALFAASGPYVCYYDLTKGLVARWSAINPEEEDVSDSEASHVNGDDHSKRPAKRQKISGNCDIQTLLSRQDSEDSVEIISERVKGQRRKPKPVAKTKPSDVSHILATREGTHVVVVTTDDKCVRVLERTRSGKLRIMSERCMPKRLCAIALTADGQTIVAGDKFGDVYSLPLFPTNENIRATSEKAPSHHQYDHILDFKPSASELTVHTKGNLEALRQQKLQKQTKSKKESPTFEHRLLLGHVSLLTDLAIAEIDGERGRRQYVLTADRDEHIRVSRGISQAHVIESYCLGHKDFVSKLCVLPWQPTTLIAGSGEPSLKVYAWQQGVSTLDLLSLDAPIAEYIEMYSGPQGLDPDRALDRLAISGIWTMQTSDTQGYILATLEGLPLLLAYFHDGETFTRCMTTSTNGNILDVAIVKERKAIIVSIDNVHQMCSMKIGRKEPFLHGQGDAIRCFEMVEATHAAATSIDSAQRKNFYRNSLWIDGNISRAVLHHVLLKEPAMAEVQLEETQQKHKSHKLYSKLGDFLYGLENLRKQRGYEAVEGEDEGDAAETEDAAE